MNRVDGESLPPRLRKQCTTNYLKHINKAKKLQSSWQLPLEHAEVLSLIIEKQVHKIPAKLRINKIGAIKK